MSSKAVVGLLVDVSGSMKGNLRINKTVSDEDVTRAQTIFHILSNIVMNDEASESIDLCVVALGLNYVRYGKTCDLIGLLEFVTAAREDTEPGYDQLAELMERNGAPYVRSYVEKHVKYDDARMFYYVLSKDKRLLHEIIKALPRACKYIGYNVGVNAIQKSLSNNVFANKEEKAADEAIERAREAVMSYLMNKKGLSHPKVYKSNHVLNLLRKASGCEPDSEHQQQRLTTDQLSKLVKQIEPYIYGGTPMCAALRSISDIYIRSNMEHKILFILSDGESTDGDPVRQVKQLKTSTKFQRHALISFGVLVPLRLFALYLLLQDYWISCAAGLITLLILQYSFPIDRASFLIQKDEVTVFCCLLAEDNVEHPKQLYDRSESSWSLGQRSMFDMSSSVSNDIPAMSALLAQKWQLGPSGTSRLFVQTNHPEVIDECANVVSVLSTSNDALLNMIGTVDLDIYINRENSGFTPQCQTGDTCYANAVAAVFHLAMSRIVGRQGGVPDFFTIRERLIQAYGVEGAVIWSVLHNQCPSYRLRYKAVDELGARMAINARRPVVATFYLSGGQWDRFGEFYKKTPRGILTKADMKVSKPSSFDEVGHAVVLIRCDPTCLTFMNSWGFDWGDRGFFRVQTADVLDANFYDVFWFESDLKDSEKEAWRKKCKVVGSRISDSLPAGFHELPYECPKCKRKSRASEFSGHLLEAICPKCSHSFKPTVKELMQSLYVR